MAHRIISLGLLEGSSALACSFSSISGAILGDLVGTPRVILDLQLWMLLFAYLMLAQVPVLHSRLALGL